MNCITAKTRITVGLAFLSVSVLLAAVFIGMIPDRRGAILDGRRKLCESVAINSSILVSRKDLSRLEAILQVVVKRNDELLSAGIRNDNGELVVEIGNHVGNWKSTTNEHSSESQLHVPLRAGDSKWGEVEMRFQPLTQPGLWGFLMAPLTRLIVFCGAAGYLVCLLYMQKMLKHLDPSKAVPKRVRTALDNLAEGLFIMQPDERIVFANKAFAEWVGIDVDKLLGRPVSKLPWTSCDELPLGEYPWSRAVSEQMQITGEFVELRNGNKRQALMVNAMPILGGDDSVRAVLVSLDDVTQLEDTKKELQESKVVAEDANRAKSDFLARMSHEIRTPMNAILGYTDVLRRGFDENVKDRREYLDTIHGSGEHLLTLINDILDLSKIESGRLDLELDRYSPFQIMSQVVSVLNVRAEEKGIEFGFECDGQLPETILTDSVRLRQAIINLAGNAIKFTDKGSVRIVTRMLNRSAKPKLQIDVIDTGIGIAQESLDEIFNPFSQADSTITRRFGGTGLGLAISRQLAEALGGQLKVESEIGKGSTFTITVDTGSLKDVRLLSADEAKLAIEQEAQAKPNQTQLPPSRILVADDGESNRKLLRLVLSRAGATVDIVENGQEALDLALRQPYDVILMDMQMPVLDGYTATSRLRESGYELPIIALTAHAMQGDEEKCRAAGCSGFLTKPIDIDLLVNTLSKVVKPGHKEESMPSQTSHCTLAVGAVNENQIDTIQLKVSEAVETPEPLEGVLDDLNAMASDIRTPEPASPETSGDVSPTTEIAAPIFSSLPTDDLDFLEIVVEFVERLTDKLDAMRQAWQQNDLAELASLAHWLKGSGGTAGFNAFTDPALELEKMAKEGADADIEQAIDGLRLLADRIVVNGEKQLDRNCDEETDKVADSMQSQELGLPSMESTLPTEDSEFCEIVIEFVDKLHSQLNAMESALTSGDMAKIASLAHWLKGSGGTAGFDAFTAPARELEQMAKVGRTEDIQTVIEQLRHLAHRIATPSAVRTL